MVEKNGESTPRAKGVPPVCFPGNAQTDQPEGELLAEVWRLRGVVHWTTLRLRDSGRGISGGGGVAAQKPMATWALDCVPNICLTPHGEKRRRSCGAFPGYLDPQTTRANETCSTCSRHDGVNCPVFG